MYTNSFQIFRRRWDQHLNQYVRHLRLEVGGGGGGVIINNYGLEMFEFKIAGFSLTSYLYSKWPQSFPNDPLNDAFLVF